MEVIAKNHLGPAIFAAWWSTGEIMIRGRRGSRSH